MSATEPLHRALFSVDVEKWGDPRRKGNALATVRTVLFNAVRESFESSGIDWSACEHIHQGDGMIVVVPPELPKSRLVDPLLDTLAGLLRRHNRQAGPATQIRVRVALHAGEVRYDEFDLTSRAVNLLARLLDAPALRNALATAPETATVAVAASDSFYQDVIADGDGGIDPDVYVPVTVRVKETTTRAWLHLPRHAPPAPVGAEPGPATLAPAPPPADHLTPNGGRGGIHFAGPVDVRGDVVGGDKHVYGDGR
ncbi:MAG TPA: hypothetical protein VLJ59_11470 [Mycobacteriales bacterium]|nr:hypothetical protein [Mycobacteriales bacterium]